MFLANLATLGEMHQQGLRRTIEDSFDEVRHHASDDFRTGLGRMVNIGALARFSCHSSFLLKDAHHSQHRRVCNLSVSEELLVDFANGGTFSLPDYLHNLELEIRKSDLSLLQGD